jgi:choline dehydrogenase-like flavoprotein
MEFVFMPRFISFVDKPKPNTSYVTFLTAIERPFSTGSVHINTSDPNAPALMDPAYYSVDADKQMAKYSIQYLTKLMSTEPLKSILNTIVSPPKLDLTDAELDQYVVENTSSQSHQVGSCSMMKRNDGGVVDSRFRVYGVNGLRVVDASIFPLHFATHPQASCYGIAEKAAEYIKQDAKN